MHGKYQKSLQMIGYIYTHIYIIYRHEEDVYIYIYGHTKRTDAEMNAFEIYWNFSP